MTYLKTMEIGRNCFQLSPTFSFQSGRREGGLRNSVPVGPVCGSGGRFF